MQFELWGLFSSSFIASTLLPGGSEVLLAWLIKQGDIALWQLLAVAVLGNSLGGIITYASGQLIAHFYPAKVLNKKHQLKARAWIEKRGPIVLLLSWLPIVGDPLCLVAGWLKLSWFQSCLYIVIGKALRYIAIAGLFSF